MLLLLNLKGTITATDSILFWLFFTGSHHRLHTAHKETRLVFIDHTKANWHTTTYLYDESKRWGWWCLLKDFRRRVNTYLKKWLFNPGHKFHIYLQASHLAWNSISGPFSMLGLKRFVCSQTALVNCNFVSFSFNLYCNDHQLSGLVNL